MFTKECVGFFKFYVGLELFAYIKKRPGFYTLGFYNFINNLRSKQNKKNPTQLFVAIIMQKTCAKFQQKIFNYMVVGTRQSSDRGFP